METAASIIAILQLSEKVIQYVRDVSGATEERRRLREQVRACSNILLLLRDGVEDSDEGQAWAETVDMLASPLERLRRALELAAIRLHAKSSTKEKLKWPFKEKEVQKLIEAIESEKGLLTLAFENNSARLLQQIDIRSKNNSTHLEELTALMSTHAINSEGHLQDLKSAVSKLQDTHISLHEDMSALEEAEKIRELAAKRVKIIDWLSPLDHTSQQHDIISKRQVGTGDWFLRSNQYQQWLKNKGGLLFCPGIPGAGKTILTSIAVADLRERYHRDARVATVFYYIDFRRQQTIDNIFLSLLKQLVEGRTELSKSVANYYDQHHERGTRPILDDAVTAFCNELRLYSRVFVVIDALDESQAGADLVSTVLDVQKDGRFNLLATSRSLPEISTQFADAAVLEIRASHQDVRTYLEAHIRQLPGFVKTNVKLQEEIKASIVRLVQGMFLLAKLHIDALVGKRSIAAIRKSLQAFDTGTEAYDAAYSIVMERIGNQVADQVELAHEILAWIVHARRRLTTLELQEALGVEIGEHEFDSDNCPDVDDIVSVCAGLVTIDQGTNVIRLVHYTTQEYFERNHERWFPDAEAMIANVCITYLSCYASRAILHPQLGRHTQHAASRFYEYAALNWGHHAGRAPTTFHETMRLLRQPTHVKLIWPAIYKSCASDSNIFAFRTGKTQSTTGLHLAAYFGLETAASTLVHETSIVDAHKSNDITPIMIAALRGHETIVKLLLDHNATVDPNPSGLMPLYFAACGGHTSIVQLLLNRRPTVQQDLKRYEPLYRADILGHESVVKLLLQHYTYKSTSKIQQAYALKYAVQDGDDTIVEGLLSKKEAGSFVRMGLGTAPLHEATYCGSLRIVQFLLDKNEPTNTISTDGESPLHVAARSGQNVIGKVLLQAGASIDSQNYWRQDALHLALEGGHDDFVKMLLDYCNDVQQHTDLGGFALLKTIGTYREPVFKMKLLLTGGVDANFQVAGESALQRACKYEKFATAKLLLEAGATVNHWDTIRGQSILFTMVAMEKKASVRFLLEAGADPNYLNPSRQSPLHAACLHHSFGHTVIPQLLIDAGAKVDIRDQFGRTPLHIACLYRSYGCEKIVQFILDSGADVNAQDEYGKSPLHFACTNEHVNLVSLLLDRGANICCADIYGNLPLHIACWWEDEAIARLILAAGAVVDCQNKVGDYPLHHACWEGHETVIKLLLGAGAEVICSNNSGKSPLDDSRSRGHTAIVDLLVEHVALNSFSVPSSADRSALERV